MDGKPKVAKFGGSTMHRTPHVVLNVLPPAVLVVSAVSGMTNALCRGDVVLASKIFRKWMRRHGVRLTEAMSMCLDRMLSIPPKTPESVSYGEKLTALAAAEMLLVIGRPAIVIFADSFMFARESSGKKDLFDCDLVDCDTTQLEAMIRRGITPVVTGYCARHMETDRTVLLGRDGSDVTAAFLANRMRCECFIITDVNGVMSCDPRMVPEARNIPFLSKAEARELAFYGANVLHRKTLDVVGSSPLHIINIHGYGTTIRDQRESLHRPVALALLYYRRIVTVAAAPEVGFCSRVASAVSREGISMEMIIQTCSETEISVAVDEEHAEKCAVTMRQFGEVSISQQVGILTLVGDGMCRAVGLTGKIFSALDNHNIDVPKFNQGRCSLSLAVHIDDMEAAAKVIHSFL